MSQRVESQWRRGTRGAAGTHARSAGLAMVVVIGALLSVSVGRGAFARSSSAQPGAEPGGASGVSVLSEASVRGQRGTFGTYVYLDNAGHSMTYYLYTPATYNPAKSYPLVLVLHGGGERANPRASVQQNRQRLLGQYYVQAFAAPAVQNTWPCFVVAPQVAGSQRWVNVPPSRSSYSLAQQPSVSLALAKDIVDTLRGTVAGIDGNRVYVVGVSMGGFGAWEAIERWPGTFAAAMPISGAGDPSQAAALRGFPIWAFHGAADPIVPVAGSRTMIAAILAAGGSPCYTEYPGQGHGVWNTERMLSDPQTLAWLFSQTKAPSGRAPPETCPAQS